MANYAYALAEAESRIACLTVGLDPGIGFFHVDQPARDSLALDLLEVARPAVDRFLLDLVRDRTFAASDFVETRQGICRVAPPLTHRIAEGMREWGRAIAPVTEAVAVLLAGAAGPGVPTPLTGDKRRAARGLASPRPPVRVRPALPSCGLCGAELADAGRVVCDGCLPERRRENTAALASMGPAALAELRARGLNPTNTPAAARKRGRANAAHVRAALAWDREHEAPDAEVFRSEILPLIQSVSLKRMARATGLAPSYCSLIRRGLYVPHPRHWEALRVLGESAAKQLATSRRT